MLGFGGSDDSGHRGNFDLTADSRLRNTPADVSVRRSIGPKLELRWPPGQAYLGSQIKGPTAFIAIGSGLLHDQQFRGTAAIVTANTNDRLTVDRRIPGCRQRIRDIACCGA